MVATALNLILKFIEQNRNVRIMKRWSQRFRRSERKKSWYLRKLVGGVKMILNLISGGEIVEMLKDVLTKKEIDTMTLPKYTNVIKNLSLEYENTPYKSRHNLMRPFKNANFKYAQLKRLGFCVSRSLWNTCTDTNPRNLGGGKSIPEYLKDAIASYLNESSSIASNRLVKNKNPNHCDYKSIVPVRYLEDAKIHLYKQFFFSDQLSASTFLKYLNASGEFKKPFRWTDLCEYCEQGFAIRKIIINEMESESLDTCNDEYFDIFYDSLKTKYASIQRRLNANLDNLLTLEIYKSKLREIKAMCNNIRDYKAIIFHKNVAKTQRKAYNNQRQNVELLRNKLLIEVDFKQKIVIGLSPRQVSSEYYNQVSRAFLGFGIYYVENDQIKTVNFDIVSLDLKTDARAAVRGFRILRSQEFFKKIDTNDYIVWADTGKHFRCAEFIGYLMRELAALRIHVNLNFFGDKHGKNARDCHFSNVSRFIKAESLKKQINSSEDIVEAIIRSQRNVNETKIDKSKKETTYVISIDQETDNQFAEQNMANLKLFIRNVESFYNYRTTGKDFKIVTSILSNHNEFIEIKVKSSDKAVVSYANNEAAAEVEKQDAPVNVLHLYTKMYRINNSIRKIKENAEQSNIDDPTRELFNYFSKLQEEGLENDRDDDFGGNSSDDGDVVNNEGDDEAVEFSDAAEADDDDSYAYIIEIPETCRPLPGTQRKPACSDCKARCKYSLNKLLDDETAIGQMEAINELSAHGHPKSKKVNVNGTMRWRSTNEARQELANHYMFAHKMRKKNGI